MTEILEPIKPGEILLEDFLKPMDITPNKLAVSIGVDATRIHQIVNGKRAISADTAIRLSRFFSTSAEFWMNAQAGYDLQIAIAETATDFDRILLAPWVAAHVQKETELGGK